MRKLYSILYVNRLNGIVLRKFDTTVESPYFLNKQKEEQLKKVLDKHLDLEKKDIEIREYNGVIEDND